jgi:hypothetical protein
MANWYDMAHDRNEADAPRSSPNLSRRGALTAAGGLLASGALPHTSRAAQHGGNGSIDSVTATEETITVEGTLASGGSRTLELYELATYESTAVVQDIDPVTTATAAGGSFSIDLERHDGDRDRYFSKFLVRDPDASADVDDPYYVTDVEFDPVYSGSHQTPQNKKGIDVRMVGDVEELGVSSTKVNIVAHQYIKQEEPENSIEHEVDGQTFYFDADAVEGLDNEITQLSQNGTPVFAVILSLEPDNFMTHPDAVDAQRATTYAFNTVEPEGVRHYRAFLDFMMQRYSRDDEKYGRLSHYIISNEVDASWVWNNMGEKTVSEMVADYVPAVRIAHQVAQQYDPDIKAEISLTHNWGETTHDNPTRFYAGQDVVEEFDRVAKRHGNFHWHVAFHPYPQNLRDPRFWTDEKGQDRPDSPMITFKNLHVLPEYFAQDRLKFRGQRRHIDLTEQGFDTRRGAPNPEEEQAAAYALSYYKTASLDGIDNYIYHRHVDHANEGGLRFGLWTEDADAGGPNTPDEKKVLYEVFQKIDTPASLEVAEFAKDVIGIDDWGEKVPGFDPERITRRQPPTTLEAVEISATSNARSITDFESGIGGWEIAAGATDASRTTDDAFSGSGALAVEFDQLTQLWRGAETFFDQPRDFGEQTNLSLALKLPGTDANTNYTVKLKAYSDGDIAEGSLTIEGGAAWRQVAMDLAEWDGASAVDRVKVWVRGPRGNNQPWSGTLLVDHLTVAGDVTAGRTTRPDSTGNSGDGQGAQNGDEDTDATETTATSAPGLGAGTAAIATGAGLAAAKYRQGDDDNE